MSEPTAPVAFSWQPTDRLGIVVSRFNLEVTEGLLRGSLQKLSEHGLGAGQVDIFWVPGAWEIPLTLQQLAKTNRHLALIALGAVIRGQTTHDRHINRFVSLSIGKLSLEYGIPISFGVLTCKTTKQALRRSNPDGRNKGGEAAEAAIEMIRVLRAIAQE